VSAIRNTKGGERESVEIGSERVGNCGYAIPLEEKGDRIAALGHTGMYDVFDRSQALEGSCETDRLR
jgi:hypothetical protein